LPSTPPANRHPQTATRKPPPANRKPQTATRKPQTANRFALCPFSELVAIWLLSLAEGTNSQLTETTKKMNSENIKKVTNQAIEQFIVALTEGRSGEGGL
jgi:hypothetical protein